MKTDISKATPRPWKAYLQMGGKLVAACVSNNVSDATRIYGASNDGDGAANAALIVQAVNEYDALNAVAEAAKDFEITAGEFGLNSNEAFNEYQLLKKNVAQLSSIRNPSKPLTATEHNAFPKGRY